MPANSDPHATHQAQPVTDEWTPSRQHLSVQEDAPMPPIASLTSAAATLCVLLLLGLLGLSACRRAGSAREADAQAEDPEMTEQATPASGGGRTDEPIEV